MRHSMTGYIFRLVEKVARNLLANHKAYQYNISYVYCLSEMHCFLCGFLFSNSIGYGAGVTSAVFPGYNRVNGPSQAWGAWSCTHIVKQWSTGQNAHRRCTRDCSYHWWVILQYQWINFCQTLLIGCFNNLQGLQFWNNNGESPILVE